MNDPFLDVFIKTAQTNPDTWFAVTFIVGGQAMDGRLVSVEQYLAKVTSGIAAALEPAGPTAADLDRAYRKSEEIAGDASEYIYFDKLRVLQRDGDWTEFEGATWKFRRSEIQGLTMGSGRPKDSE